MTEFNTYLSYFQIYTLARNDTSLQVLLDDTKAIRKPTRVHVDQVGKRLVVINKDGTEIRHYNLHVV